MQAIYLRGRGVFICGSPSIFACIKKTVIRSLYFRDHGGETVPRRCTPFSHWMNFLESSNEILCSKTTPSGVIPLIFPSFKNIWRSLNPISVRLSWFSIRLFFNEVPEMLTPLSFRCFIKLMILPSLRRVIDSVRVVMCDKGKALERIRENVSGRILSLEHNSKSLLPGAG